MTEIARNERQITFFYNPDSSVAIKTLAYIQQSEIPVLIVDLIKNPPSSAQWLEIAEELGVSIEKFVQKDHPVFTKQYPNINLDMKDWLKLMNKHPEVIDQPIAIRGDKVVLVNTPTDILHLLNAQDHIEK